MCNLGRIQNILIIRYSEQLESRTFDGQQVTGVGINGARRHVLIVMATRVVPRTGGWLHQRPLVLPWGRRRTGSAVVPKLRGRRGLVVAHAVVVLPVDTTLLVTFR